jgi:hypothetical protein
MPDEGAEYPRRSLMQPRATFRTLSVFGRAIPMAAARARAVLVVGSALGGPGAVVVSAFRRTRWPPLGTAQRARSG